MSDEYYKKQRSSQAFQKFINYTDTLKNDPVFLSELRWFRNYHVGYDTLKPIPENGLSLPKNKEEHLDNTMAYAYMMNEKGDDYLNFSEFQDRKYAFEEKYGLDIFGEAFDFLLFYNSVEPMKEIGYSSFANIYDLVHLSKIEDRDYLGTKEEIDRYTGLFIRSEIAPITPIAVCINPYMSERDIIDFVKKTYKTAIEPIQESYRKKHIKLKDARTKSKSKQSRNEFIYENRHLPITELTSLVSDTFGQVLDYTYIQTIIRKEKGKRN